MGKEEKLIFSKEGKEKKKEEKKEEREKRRQQGDCLEQGEAWPWELILSRAPLCKQPWEPQASTVGGPHSPRVSGSTMASLRSPFGTEACIWP